MRRFKEEAEGSSTDLKEQLAAAHQERHAVEEQAKQQVLPAVHLHGMTCSEGLQLVHIPPPSPPMENLSLPLLCPTGCFGMTTVVPYHHVLRITVLLQYMRVGTAAVHKHRIASLAFQ